MAGDSCHRSAISSPLLNLVRICPVAGRWRGFAGVGYPCRPRPHERAERVSLGAFWGTPGPDEAKRARHARKPELARRPQPSGARAREARMGRGWENSSRRAATGQNAGQGSGCRSATLLRSRHGAARLPGKVIHTLPGVGLEGCWRRRRQHASEASGARSAQARATRHVRRHVRSVYLIQLLVLVSLLIIREPA